MFYIFLGCTGLTSVISLIENPFSIGDYIFGSLEGYASDYIYKNATLYVPKGKVSVYRKTYGWMRFQNIVEVTPVGIKMVSGSKTAVREKECYDLKGRLTTSKRDLNIIRTSDGRTVKVMKK